MRHDSPRRQGTPCRISLQDTIPQMYFTNRCAVAYKPGLHKPELHKQVFHEQGYHKPGLHKQRFQSNKPRFRKENYVVVSPPCRMNASLGRGFCFCACIHMPRLYIHNGLIVRAGRVVSHLPAGQDNSALFHEPVCCSMCMYMYRDGAGSLTPSLPKRPAYQCVVSHGAVWYSTVAYGMARCSIVW